jgi:hypothetical protein
MWNEETKIRTKSQKTRIIEMLKQAGEKGVFNSDLSQIALHYGKRISELYSKGYVIIHEDLGGGLVKYILVSEPEVFLEPKKAFEVLVGKINQIGSIDSIQLTDILVDLDIIVRFKNGQYKKKNVI